MNKRFKTFGLLMIAVLMFCVPLVACGGDGDDKKPQAKSEYTVVYNVNYTGGENQTRTVKAGRLANNWKAVRQGYILDGWFTDKACTKPFAFSTPINKDYTLYAKWTKETPKYTVTFNFNYDGPVRPTTAEVNENTTISSALVPGSPRIGYEISGWYKDAAKTQAWNMSTDTVTAPVTLYADYQFDPSIPTNEDGTIKFENVQISFWVGRDFGSSSTIATLINKFNRLQKDKIKVVKVDTISDATQDTICLRQQQVPNVAGDVKNAYYPVVDVYSLAGVQFDKNEYYADSIRDCYSDGIQYSIPLASSVPYIIYNKSLMTKYNPEGVMPTNFTEFKTLLLKVYDGEVGENADFKTIVTGSEWMFKECASYAPFLQNDVPYVEYDEQQGRIVNKWADNIDVDSVEYKAFRNMYDLFGAKGACHGAMAETHDDYNESFAVDKVKYANAFMGIVNWGATTVNSIANSTSTLGILPLSGLFADECDGMNSIPLQTLGVQFYKASGVSAVEVSAAALFADYLSKNCDGFIDNGYYPLSKTAMAELADKTTNTAKILKQVGDPANFRTMDGYPSLKYIFNTCMAENYIVPSILDNKLTDDDLLANLDSMKSDIVASLS